MAIMVMATVKRTNNTLSTIKCLLVPLMFTAPITHAAEWSFDPNFGITETYTDNIELVSTNPESSLVSQAILAFESEYASRNLQLSLSASETFVNYSHDRDLNDDYQTAKFNGLLSLWQSGPSLIASSELSNISKNDSDNILADLISADTIQKTTHFAGLNYNIDNNTHQLKSSLVYNITRTEDNIGESEGYTALFTSQNGNSARRVFWQIDGQYVYIENNNLDGKNYSIDTKFGAITPYRVNPFVRVYDEKIEGTVAGSNPDSTPSWGPGLRFLPSKHLIIDLSYNYVGDDNSTSEDYLAASIFWEPSQRTSLSAGYSKRFFGDSYDLDFSHRSKRLTNKVSYKETIEAFDRSTFDRTDLGRYWCPVSDISPTIANCFATNTPPGDITNYQLASFSSLTPIENNEFTLNKRLTWNSKLSLSRTDFILDLSTREREELSSGIIDEYLSGRFTISRNISPKSKLSFSARFEENTFDRTNLSESTQKDKYKIFSTTFDRKLAKSLTSFISLQYVDRESTRQDRTYDEARASINITKEF